MILLALLYSLAASASVDLRKHDATISLSPIIDCFPSESIATGLGRVNSAVKLQGKRLEVTECSQDSVRVTLVEANGQALKGKQKARQTKYLHRVMVKEGFLRGPDEAWRRS